MRYSLHRTMLRRACLLLLVFLLGHIHTVEAFHTDTEGSGSGFDQVDTDAEGSSEDYFTEQHLKESPGVRPRHGEGRPISKETDNTLRFARHNASTFRSSDHLMDRSRGKQVKQMNVHEDASMKDNLYFDDSPSTEDEGTDSSSTMMDVRSSTHGSSTIDFADWWFHKRVHDTEGNKNIQLATTTENPATTNLYHWLRHISGEDTTKRGFEIESTTSSETRVIEHVAGNGIEYKWQWRYPFADRIKNPTSFYWWLKPDDKDLSSSSLNTRSKRILKEPKSESDWLTDGGIQDGRLLRRLLKQEKRQTKILERIATKLEDLSGKSDICPAGFQNYSEGNVCLHLVKSEVTWYEAQAHCKQLGSDVNLATLEGYNPKSNLIRKIIIIDEGQVYEEYWIGGIKSATGQWTWEQSGKSINNFTTPLLCLREERDCLGVFSYQYIKDIGVSCADCKRRKKFICEKQL